jgi:antitoxin component of RelBE/YafQ-DinJ toxin-antitoxin module
MKDSYIHMRIKDDLKEQSCLIAAEKGMSLSEYVRYLLQKEIIRKEIESEAE